MKRKVWQRLHPSKKGLSQVSIKWKMLAYLAGFVTVLLLLLWLFQIVFLDAFYRGIKAASVRRATETIAKSIDDPDIESYLDSLNPFDGLCVLVVDENGKEVYSSNFLPQFNIYRLPQDRLTQLFSEAKAADHLSLSFDEKIQPHWGGGGEPWKEPKNQQGDLPRPLKNGGSASLIYGKIAHSQTKGDLLVLVNAVITPVNATVETLRVQFFYITGILLVLSLLMAAYLSRKITTPIIQINQSAKELAKGHYDITFKGGGYREIAELRDTLNYAAGELSKVESLRRELIANVSHDLRTPLTMITGYSEMIRDIPEENTPQNVQIIIDEANRLTGLVNDMLDLSKLQAGAQTLDFHPVELTELIRQILERYRCMTRLDGYRFIFECDGKAVVSGDESKLSQVVYNLVNNAITYTGADKSVTIRQTVTKDEVIIEIIDTGEGIPAENLPYIWERYYKVDKAHKRAAVGTGLGLSIVQNLVKLHRGKCGVESTVGKGSVFWFSLPLVRALLNNEE